MQRYIIFFILFFAHKLYAQSILENFLASSSENLSLKNIQAKQDVWSESRFDKTLLEKVRVNIGYSRFDKEDVDNEYEIRIYPKTFSQRDTQKTIYNLTKKEIDISYQDTKLKVLKSHYSLLLDACFQKKSYQNKQNILKLNKKRLAIAHNTTDTASDILDLSKIKYSVEDSKFDFIQQKERYQNILLEIQRYIPKRKIDEIDQAFENFSFMSVKDLVSFVSQHKNSFIDSVESSIKKERVIVSLAKDKMKLNKIKDTLRINSIDLKYENEHEFKKSLSIGLSLEYAWPGNDTLQIVNDKLKLIRAQSELSDREEKINHQILTLISEISALNGRLIYFQNSIEKDDFYRAYLNLKNPDPFVLLDLQSRHLKIKEDMITAEHKLYSRFIDLLYVSNELTKSALFEKRKI